MNRTETIGITAAKTADEAIDQARAAMARIGWNVTHVHFVEKVQQGHIDVFEVTAELTSQK